MPNIIYTRGTENTLLSTELNSLANNSNVVSTNVVTLANAGFFDGEAEIVFQFSVAPTVNTALLIWFLREIDGTNYEDGSSTVTPTRNPDIFFTVRAVTSVQRIIKPVYNIPTGPIRTLLRNSGTGQALVSSANTLKIRPITPSY
jgi:hypothetical protein